MPGILLSHQAPAIYIKQAWPNWFDGTALCIAATVPDFELVFYRAAQFFTQPADPWRWGLSHSFLGLAVYVIPMTWVGTIFFARWMAPWFAGFAMKKGRVASWLVFFGVDQWSLLRKKKFTLRWFFVAAYSAVAGALTHLLLDLFTHKNIHILFPFKSISMPDFLQLRLVDLGEMNLRVLQYDLYFDWARVCWLGTTLITAGMALWGLRIIKKKNLLEKWYCG